MSWPTGTWLNRAYYLLVDEDERHYMDYTGTGNTLDMSQPNVIRLLVDSLRYWVFDMHVDGFRFDLAAALAQELSDVKRLGAFFDIINQDPIISQVKLNRSTQPTCIPTGCSAPVMQSALSWSPAKSQIPQ